MKFKALSFMVVKRKSKLIGRLDITFETEEQRDEFVRDNESLEIKATSQAQFVKAYSQLRSTQAAFGLSVVNGKIPEVEKKALIAKLREKYPGAYDYNKPIPSYPKFSLGSSIKNLWLKTRAYLAHLYRAPSRHPYLLSSTAIALSFALAGIGALAALSIGGITFATVKAREVIYRKKGQQIAIQNLSTPVNELASMDGYKAAESWRAYLQSYLRIRDMKHWRTFGAEMTRKMDQLDSTRKYRL